MFTHTFRKNCLEKLASTLISVKVWVLFLVLFISTGLLVKEYITSDNWTTVIISCVTVVLISREGFKMTTVTSVKKKSGFVCPYAKTSSVAGVKPSKDIEDNHDGMFI